MAGWTLTLSAILAISIAAYTNAQCCPDGTNSCLTQAQSAIGPPKTAGGVTTNFGGAPVPLKVTYSYDQSSTTYPLNIGSNPVMVYPIQESRLSLEGVGTRGCGGQVPIPYDFRQANLGIAQSHFHFIVKRSSLRLLYPITCAQTSSKRPFFGAVFLGMTEERLPSKECALAIACANNACICPAWSTTGQCITNTVGFLKEPCGTGTRTDTCVDIPGMTRSTSCSLGVCTTAPPTQKPSASPTLKFTFTPTAKPTGFPTFPAKTAFPTVFPTVAFGTPFPSIAPTFQELATQAPTMMAVTKQPGEYYTIQPQSIAPVAVPIDGGIDNTGLCPYARDVLCFDPTSYPCEMCCTTNINIKGENCWDATYTKARCCKQPNEATTSPGMPTTAPTTQGSCPYQKDASCFDVIYPCEQCCTTGKATNGFSCWDSVFTKDRCCTNGATPVYSTSAPYYTPVYTPPPVTPSGQCSDGAGTGICQSWQALGYCQAYDSLQNSCTLTCGFCSTPVYTPVYTPTPFYQPIYTPPIVYTPAPVYQPPGCQPDILPNCPTWAQQGFCTGYTQIYVQENCPTSCGQFCGGAPTYVQQPTYFPPPVQQPVYNPPTYYPPTTPTYYPPTTPTYYPPTTPTYNPPTGGYNSCPTVADPTCFSPAYPCSSCCGSGLNVNGQTCWSSVFTPSRCCSTYTGGFRRSESNLASEPLSEVTDSRGRSLPARAFFDTRGNVLDSRGHAMPKPATSWDSLPHRTVEEQQSSGLGLATIIGGALAGLAGVAAIAVVAVVVVRRWTSDDTNAQPTTSTEMAPSGTATNSQSTSV